MVTCVCTCEYVCVCMSVCVLLASYPGSLKAGQKGEPGTHCLRMRQIMHMTHSRYDVL